MGAYNEVEASSGARGHRGRPHCAPSSPVSATGPPIPISNCSSYNSLAICISSLSSPLFSLSLSFTPSFPPLSDNRSHLISFTLHLWIIMLTTTTLQPRGLPLTFPSFLCLWTLDLVLLLARGRYAWGSHCHLGCFAVTSYPSRKRGFWSFLGFALFEW